MPTGKINAIQCLRLEGSAPPSTDPYALARGTGRNSRNPIHFRQTVCIVPVLDHKSDIAGTEHILLLLSEVRDENREVRRSVSLSKTFPTERAALHFAVRLSGQPPTDASDPIAARRALEKTSSP